MKIDEMSHDQLTTALRQAREDIKRLKKITTPATVTLKAAMESENRFRTLFESMPSGVAIFRAVDDGDDFVFVDYNRSGQLMDNMLREQVCGRRVTEAFPGVAEFGLLAVLRRVYRTGQPERLPVSRYKDARLLAWRENYVYKLPSGELVSIYSDVTDQKQAQQQLEESEKRLRAIFNSAGDGILAAGLRERKFIFANPAACRLLGYTTDELLGMTVNDIHPHDQLPHVIAEFEAQARGEKTLAENIPCLRKDGSVVYADISTTATTLDGQRCNIGFFRDITERKQTNQRIRVLSQALTSSNENIVITNLDHRITYVNLAFLKTYGYTEDEILGKPIGILRAPGYPEKLTREIIAGCNRGGWTGEVRNRRRDGSEFTALLSASPVHDDDGTIIALLGADVDITQRKQAETRLRVSEARYRAVTDNALDAIFSKDAERRYTFCNPMMERMLGRGRDDIIGKTPEEVFDDATARIIREVDDRCFAGEKVDAIRTITLDGKTVTLHTIQVPLYDEASEVSGVSGIVRDMTEHECLKPADGTTDLARRGHFPQPAPAGATPGSLDLASAEREKIEQALARAGGNRKAAARVLGLGYGALRYRMQKYGLL